MAAETRGAKYLIQSCEEDWMEDGQRESYVAQVPGTVDIVESAGTTELLFVAGTKCSVVESSWIRVKQVIECFWVGYQLAADALDLLGSVGDETHGREAHHGSEPRVNSTRVRHQRPRG